MIIYQRHIEISVEHLWFIFLWKQLTVMVRYIRCVLFTSFSLAIYLWFKLIYPAECVSKQKSTFIFLVAKDASIKKAIMMNVWAFCLGSMFGLLVTWLIWNIYQSVSQKIMIATVFKHFWLIEQPQCSDSGFFSDKAI